QETIARLITGSLALIPVRLVGRVGVILVRRLVTVHGRRRSRERIWGKLLAWYQQTDRVAAFGTHLATDDRPAIRPLGITQPLQQVRPPRVAGRASGASQALHPLVKQPAGEASALVHHVALQHQGPQKLGSNPLR